MFTCIVALVVGLAPPPTEDRLAVNLDAVRERLASYLIVPGMTPAAVQRLLGLPFAMDTFGPIGEWHTVYSYLASGISVTFGPDDRVMGVSR